MTIDLEQIRVALTVAQSAEYLGTSEEFILDLIARNELPASNINTKPNAQRPRWRILPSDLGNFMAKTRMPSVQA